MKPGVVIIAGPNGSGKSTLTKQLQADPTFEFPETYINADDLARVAEGTQEECELAASHQARALRQTYQEQEVSHAFETVFSHESNLKELHTLKEAGFDVTLVFVTTGDPKINVERVARRVQEGGHDVPREKIISRYERSMELLPQACEIADRTIIFDASDHTRLAAWIDSHSIDMTIDAPAYLYERLGVALPPEKQVSEQKLKYDYETPDEYLKHLTGEGFDVSTPTGKAVFYGSSYGGETNSVLNQEPGSRIPLTETPGGKWLFQQALRERFEPTEVDNIWEVASKRYALEASGEIQVLLNSEQEEKHFCQTELRELLFNEKVTQIAGKAREELLPLYTKYNLDGHHDLHALLSQFEATEEPGNILPTLRKDRIEASQAAATKQLEEMPLPEIQIELESVASRAPRYSRD